MTLQKKHVIAVTMVFAFLMLVLYSISKAVIMDSFTEIEQARTHRNVERILSALSNEISGLDVTAAGWAGWNDTYNFMVRPDKDYIESNLSDSTFLNLRWGLFLLVDNSGSIVLGKGFDLKNKREIPVPVNIREHLLPGSVLINHPDTSSSVKGVVLLPEGPLLVASRPILTSRGEGPIHGTLILGRYLDDTLITHLGEIMLLSADIRRLDEERLPADFQKAVSSLQKKKSILVQPLSESTIAGYAILEDVSGNPSIVLRVDLTREIYRQSKISMLYFVMLILAFSLVFGMATLLFLENADRRKTEETLRVSEERFRTAFQYAAIGMALVGTDGTWLQVNRSLCEMLGYTEEELLYKKFELVTHPDDLATDFDCIHRLLTGESRFCQYEKRYFDKAGNTVWVLLTVSMVRGSRGEPLYFVPQIQDITQRRRAEADLAEARKKADRAERMAAMGTLAAGIAHEINQPLNSLKIIVDGMLYLDEKGISFEFCEVAGKLREISAQADRIDGIIKRMRAFVRNDKMVDLVPCDLNLAVNRALEIIGNQLSLQNIRVKKWLAEGLPAVMGDMYRLEGVVINLVINAMQALVASGREDREVYIATCHEANVILEISDNATGIVEDYLDKVFDPFFTTKEAGEGMGLGLSITHSVVASFGGQIHTANNERGGATFRVVFPVP